MMLIHAIRGAIANTLVGVVSFYMIVSPILHYTGAWYGHYLPMSDPDTYDNTGSTYDVSRVLTPQFTLDEAKYKDYSPLFIRFVVPPDLHWWKV